MKYALLDNNQIKVGPRDWNRGFWDIYLNEVGIESDLPWVYNSEETIIINDNIKIVPVVDPTIPTYNSRTEQLAGPYWDVTKTPITGYYDIADIPLESAKNALKAIVAVNRYNQEVKGLNLTIQDVEVFVPTGRGQDRDIWLQSLVLLDDTDTIRYKFSSDIWLDLTKIEVKTIVDSIKAHVQAAFAWEYNKSVEIDAAQDKAALEAIEVTYPEVV